MSRQTGTNGEGAWQRLWTRRFLRAKCRGQVHTLDSNDIKIGRTRKADLVLVLDIHKGQTESLRE
jgi:hypothetical protein